MKSIFTIATALFISAAGWAQNDSIKSEGKDTTRIVIGKKEIQIVDGEEGTDIKVKKKEQVEIRDEEITKNFDDNTEKKGKKGKRSGGFRGHWQGLDLGLNNYLDHDNSFSLKGNDEFMSLRTSRSINVNLNMVQHSFGIIGNQLGFVTGLGLEFYNYFFEKNLTIVEDAYGIIVPEYAPVGIDYDKTKLSMSYLTVPLLFEFQFPGHLKNSKRLRVAAGVMGGLKLRSHTKVVYHDNGKQKIKNWEDFNINPFRYGFTGRVGYKHVNLYVNYYPVALFQNGKGPELYPISIGISFVSL